jgi:tripartite-type tricarboxylate transporter receptor subunit TctC
MPALISEDDVMVAKAIRLMTTVILAIAAGAACAQAPKPSTYPVKPVRIIVGYATGGATDIVGRLIAQKLSESTGQSFFVENRPGASATIACELVARSAPDGYTLLIAATTSHSILPSLMKLNYDAQRDFAPVSELVTSPLLLAVHPSLPIRSVSDMIKLARARPGQLTFGAGGTGTPPHLAGELFKQMTGVQMLYVPYKGEGPAIVDLMAGQISLIFSNVVAVLPQVEAQRLRGIAVTSAERLPTLPEFPTVSESGVPGFIVDAWFGLVGPTGMPAEVISRLNAEIARGMNQPDLRDKLARQGLFVKTSTPAALTSLMQAETAKWAKVVKAAGIRLE